MTVPPPPATPAEFDFIGEYEKKKDMPCKVNRVRFKGNARTSTKVLEREFKRVYEARTLDEIQKALYEAQESLMELGIVRTSKVLCDRPKDGENDSMDVTVLVSERPANLKLEASTTKGEVTVGGAAQYTNLLGIADTYSAEVQHGSLNSNLLKANATFPYIMGVKGNLLSMDIFQSHLRRIYSSFGEQVRGACLALKNERHAVALDAHWREINYQDKASISVREQTGHSVKASIRHEYTYDTRNNPSVPTEGIYWKHVTELAGLFGNVSFLKLESLFQRTIPLPADCALTLGIGGGWIRNLERHSPGPVRINDRFFLGGPNTFRGFRTHGVGPHDGKDSIGGDVYGVASASVSAPALFSQLLTKLGIRLHAFASVGSLTFSNPSSGIIKEIVRFGQEQRMSIGCGFVIPSVLGRIELNLVRPIRRFGDDTPSDTLQFGLGIIL